MILYVILFLFLAALSFSDFLQLREVHRMMILCIGGLVVFLIFWGMATFRWECGTDWLSYFDLFYYFSEEHTINFEPGYIWLMSFIKVFTSNYTAFLTVFSFLCISFKFSFFFKFHKEIFFTLIFLFYCYYFGDIFSVRQNLAISLTLFSTVFIIKEKPIYFLLLVGLATTIHSASILYFFAYFIYWSKIKDKVFYYFIGFSIIFGLSGGGLILLNFVFERIGIEGLVADKVAKYLNEENESLNTNIDPVLLYVLGTTKRLIFIPIFVYIRDRTINKFQNIQGYFNLYMTGSIIYFLFAKDLAVFVRASVPFLFFEVILLGYVLMYYKNSKRKLLAVFVLMLFFSWSRFDALINSYYDLYVPYNSIFDKKIERIY